MTQNAVVPVDPQGGGDNGNNGVLPEEEAVGEKPYKSGKITHVRTVR